MSDTLYVTPAGLALAPDGSILVADYGFALDRISGTRLVPIITFGRISISGLPGIFRPSGIAVGNGGEIYAITDGVNGGTNTPALISTSPTGDAHLLLAGANTR